MGKLCSLFDWKSAENRLSSTKKKRTFRASKAYVTSGTVLRELSSSPIGNITIFFLGLVYPGVFDHVEASNRGSLVVLLLFTAFMNLPFNSI